MKESESKPKSVNSLKKRFIQIPTKAKLGILFVLLIIGYFTYTKLLSPKPQTQYQTTQAQKGTIVSSVSASGPVLTTNFVPITTSSTGIVDSVLVKNGQYVKAGQKIAEITMDLAGQAKNEQALSSYLAAKTSLDAASANAFSLRSTKDTAWKKFYDIATSSQYQNPDGSPREDMRNSSAEFQSAQGDWLADEAKYKNQTAVIVQSQTSVSSSWLSFQQSSPTVYAPISGTIDNVTAIPGMVLASSGSTTTINSPRLAVIKNSGTPSISVNLSEVDVPKIKPDQKVTVTLDSISDKTFTGKVVTIDKIGTVTNNVTNYPAIITFDLGSEQILPNMAASANIIIETKDDVLLVATAAIQNQNGQATIRVLKNGQVQTVTIETGLVSDSQTEITSGLSEGDEIATGTSSTTTATPTQSTSPFGRTGGGGFGGGLRTGGGGRGD